MCGIGLLSSPTSSMQVENVNLKYNSMAGAPSWTLQHGGPATWEREGTPGQVGTPHSGKCSPERRTIPQLSGHDQYSISILS